MLILTKFSSKSIFSSVFAKSYKKFMDTAKNDPWPPWSDLHSIFNINTKGHCIKLQKILIILHEKMICYSKNALSSLLMSEQRIIMCFSKSWHKFEYIILIFQTTFILVFMQLDCWWENWGCCVCSLFHVYLQSSN